MTNNKFLQGIMSGLSLDELDNLNFDKIDKIDTKLISEDITANGVDDTLKLFDGDWFNGIIAGTVINISVNKKKELTGIILKNNTGEPFVVRLVGGKVLATYLYDTISYYNNNGNDITTQFTTFKVLKTKETVIKGSLVDSDKNRYKPLLSRVSTKQTQDNMAKIINKTIPNKSESIRTGVLFLAKQEQSFKGFNFNFYGVMADIANWSYSKYFNGSFSSTEGSGGKGVRTSKIRYFASFATIEDGITFIALQLEKKKWDDADANNITTKYYGSWLFGNPNNQKVKDLISKDNGRKRKTWESVNKSIRKAV